VHRHGEQGAADAPVLLLEEPRAHRLAVGRRLKDERPQIFLKVGPRRLVDPPEDLEEKPADRGHIRKRHQPDGALARSAHTNRRLRSGITT
jgi:hypothetical protein